MNLRLWWAEYLIKRDVQRILDLFDMDIQKTSAWREIYSRYDPLIGLTELEDLFENAYLRTPRGNRRNQMLFFYLIRSGDIHDWNRTYSYWAEKKQRQFRKLLGHGRITDMLRYLEPANKELLYVFPG